VLVICKIVHTLEIFVPVEHFDCHVIGARQNVGARWVNHNVSDVILMIFDGFNFLVRVVVVDANFVIVRANHDPLLASDKLRSANRGIRHF
jgi:hypothetical protein